MKQLKLCPFCGGEAILVATSGCSGLIACIGECKIETSKFWDSPMTKRESERTKWHEQAVEAWNRRTHENR